ncbi:alpha/beta hydrolase [Halobacillus litoralis]|uniref:alpha/beta fold hydrolase n=1 Tax=Halobacillus litoralis TaxID=45668 RepID=UPI001CD6FD23|nr:alpha/beta hydrolase [Halobacillus litoralis]MCA0969708.1 alpha/beta hydrolase [Halobacillus litoralis]
MSATLLDTSKGIVEFSYKGIGPTILLLKGGHSTRETDLSHSSLIYEGYSLLSISRPGYDCTDLSTGATPSEFSNSIIEVLDHLSIESVRVIAVSDAGPLGISLAAHYPDRVEKLMMEAAVVSSWDEQKTSTSSFLHTFAKERSWGGIHTMLKVFPDFVMKQVLKELTTENVEDYLNELSPNDRRFIYDMILTLNSSRPSYRDLSYTVSDLSKIKVPVLGMYAQKDKWISYTNALLLKSKVPHSEIYESHADSHLIWIGKDAQELWNKRLNFLAQPTKEEARHG